MYEQCGCFAPSYISFAKILRHTKLNFAKVPMDDDMEEVLIGSSGYTEQVYCHIQSAEKRKKIVPHDHLSGVITQIIQARRHGR